MTKILILSGSPVDGSSTDILLETAAEALVGELGEDHDVDIVRVRANDLKGIPCQACGEVPESGWCIYDDDITPVLDQIAEADCLLVGTPLYFDSISAQLKKVVDRCNCFSPPDYDNVDPDHEFLRLIKHRRPGGMIIVGSGKGFFEGARKVIAGLFKWIRVVNEGMVVYHSDDYHRKGTVIEDADSLSQARQLGRKLAEKVISGYER